MASSDTESLPIPADELTDSAEVLRCLESARDAWRTGQQREAVRWLQRGAEAAEQDGNDMRALGFARAAADLSAQVGASGPPPLPAGESASIHTSASGSESRAAKTNGGASSAVSPTPPPKPVKEVSAGALSPPSSRGAASTAPSAPSAPSRPPSASRVPSRPRASSTSSAASSPASASPPASTAAGAAPAAGSAQTSHKDFAKAPEAAPLSASLAELLEGGLAQRVSVKRSALDEGLLVVRPSQGTGSKGPHGTRQAVLVYVESSD